MQHKVRTQVLTVRSPVTYLSLNFSCSSNSKISGCVAWVRAVKRPKKVDFRKKSTYLKSLLLFVVWQRTNRLFFSSNNTKKLSWCARALVAHMKLRPCTCALYAHTRSRICRCAHTTPRYVLILQFLLAHTVNLPERTGLLLRLRVWTNRKLNISKTCRFSLRKYIIIYSVST